MRPPCEVMVVQLLPAFRALVSHHLMEDHGFTQNQVAEALGVTQASVSRSRTQLKRFSKHYTPRIRRSAEELAKQLAQRTISLEESIAILCSFCRNQKIGGVLCQLHREENPDLATCKVCGERVTPDFRIHVLNSLTRGSQLLQESTEFTQLIPQVQSQLVMSIPDACDIDDVAGFPSRIGILDSKAHTYTGPEFGASTHLARILLVIQELDTTMQAAIVLKFQSNMEAIFVKQKLRYVRADRESVQGQKETDEALLTAIREALAQSGPVNILIDEGLVGIEPVVYLFSEDAEQAATQAISLAKLLAT